MVSSRTFPDGADFRIESGEIGGLRPVLGPFPEHAPLDEVALDPEERRFAAGGLAQPPQIPFYAEEPSEKPRHLRAGRDLPTHTDETPQGSGMSERPFNVLFLCTGNSARSIIAEAILNKLGQSRFHAYSAGSQPKGEVNPNTLALLRGLDYDTSAFRSKSWMEFSRAT